MPFLADPLISTQHGTYIDTVRETAFNSRSLLTKQCNIWTISNSTWIHLLCQLYFWWQKHLAIRQERGRKNTICTCELYI